MPRPCAAGLPNGRLLAAIHALAFFSDAGSLQRVNYRDMGTEELGSVYEVCWNFIRWCRSRRGHGPSASLATIPAAPRREANASSQVAIIRLIASCRNCCALHLIR